MARKLFQLALVGVLLVGSFPLGSADTNGGTFTPRSDLWRLTGDAPAGMAWFNVTLDHAQSDWTWFGYEVRGMKPGTALELDLYRLSDTGRLSFWMKTVRFEDSGLLYMGIPPFEAAFLVFMGTDDPEADVEVELRLVGDDLVPAPPVERPFLQVGEGTQISYLREGAAAVSHNVYTSSSTAHTLPGRSADTLVRVGYEHTLEGPSFHRGTAEARSSDETSVWRSRVSLDDRSWERQQRQSTTSPSERVLQMVHSRAAMDITVWSALHRTPFERHVWAISLPFDPTLEGVHLPLRSDDDGDWSGTHRLELDDDDCAQLHVKGVARVGRYCHGGEVQVRLAPFP